MVRRLILPVKRPATALFLALAVGAVGVAWYSRTTPRAPQDTADATDSPAEPAPEASELAEARLEIARLRAENQALGQRLKDLEGTPATPTPVVTSPPRRPWSPEQAVGAPDTFADGDLRTAWASAEPDGGLEWLQLTYDRAVEIAQVRVRETFNPGAIYRVAAVDPAGKEIALWQGTEPVAAAPVEMEFTPNLGVTARCVRLYLDTRRIPGWNEIDAVEVVGTDGSRQWASGATASSTYADRVQISPMLGDMEIEGFRGGNRPFQWNDVLGGLVVPDGGGEATRSYHFNGSLREVPAVVGSGVIDLDGDGGTPRPTTVLRVLHGTSL